MKPFETPLGLIVEIQEDADVIDDYHVKTFNISLELPGWDVIECRTSRKRNTRSVELVAEKPID